MRIKKIQVRNFKSLVDFKLENLNPFCAFVGPNASGKSNIFEALEFANYTFRYSFEAPAFFGGKESIHSFNPRTVEDKDSNKNGISYLFEFNDGIIIDFNLKFTNGLNRNQPIGSIGSTGNLLNGVEQLKILDIRDLNKRENLIKNLAKKNLRYENDYEVFVDRFSRIFIGKTNLVRRFGSPSLSLPNLSPDASNLSQIIGKIFEDDNTRADFVEWLQLLIPEFEDIEVKKSNIDGGYDFSIFEKSSKKSFSRYLISDGTYNILALMAAVYQSKQPQFLCIEEPENGLHPQAIQLLIDFFREKCDEMGHHIWLNTHSSTLVRTLNIDEVILVNKQNGKTVVKQMTKEDAIDIKTDEAWLTNALGGGTLWSI